MKKLHGKTVSGKVSPLPQWKLLKERNFQLFLQIGDLCEGQSKGRKEFLGGLCCFLVLFIVVMKSLYQEFSDMVGLDNCWTRHQWEISNGWDRE